MPIDAGHALLRHAYRVQAELESLQVEMASFVRDLRGTVRLQSNTAEVSEALPRRTGRFVRGIAISVRTGRNCPARP